MLELSFHATLWKADAESAWYFVSLPTDSQEVLKEEGRGVGFGSVRVEVTIGATTWRTSVFPDSKKGTFVLPVKAAVRSAEGIEEGDRVDVRLRIMD